MDNYYIFYKYEHGNTWKLLAICDDLEEVSAFTYISPDAIEKPEHLVIKGSEIKV